MVTPTTFVNKLDYELT